MSSYQIQYVTEENFPVRSDTPIITEIVGAPDADTAASKVMEAAGERHVFLSALFLE